jgi:hypothetical protein
MTLKPYSGHPRVFHQGTMEMFYFINSHKTKTRIFDFKNIAEKYLISLQESNIAKCLEQ